MTGILAALAGALALMFSTFAADAAPNGRPVPTQTIIMPSEDDRIMPPIPPPDSEDPADTIGNVAPDTPDADEPVGPPPTIQYDASTLPAPVRRLREQIIEAAKSGDPQKLRPIIDANDAPPDFGSDTDEDPIAYLTSLSGDPEGREILAILLEVLEAGFVHVDVGTPDEMYIWPYFARYPLESLTPPQIVELFKIVLAGDFEDMKQDGAYTSFRVGISPDGRWNYFLVSD